MKLSIQALLEAVLASPGDRALLKQVSERAPEFLSYLEQEPSQAVQDQLSQCPTAWMAEVYGAIVGEADDSPEEIAASEILNQPNVEQDLEIGRAFAEALMSNLPYSLKQIDDYLRDVPEVEEEEMIELGQEPSVKAGLPYSEQLVRYGVTPLTIFYSTEAVAGLFNRMLRHDVIASEEAILKPIMESPDDVTNYQLVTNAIANLSECDLLVAQALLPWIVDVARYKPLLFRGFMARPRGQAILLKQNPHIETNLYRRWQVQRQRVLVPPTMVPPPSVPRQGFA